MEASKLGLYFDEFVVGETVEHALSKTIFESDNNFFSLLTMNHHPVHTNLDYARKNQHGQLLVVGTLVFSLVVGMTVPDISGKAIANLGYEAVKHLGPVFVNAVCENDHSRQAGIEIETRPGSSLCRNRRIQSARRSGDQFPSSCARQKASLA